MNDLSILLQRTPCKERDQCFVVANGTARFNLAHGDQWPGDIDRKDGYFNRAELSLKPRPDETRWLTGTHSFEYTVRTAWASMQSAAGAGHVILGQLHQAGHGPLFSLRWAPGTPRLWMDFIGRPTGGTDKMVQLEDIRSSLQDDDPLAVRIESSRAGAALSLNVTVRARSGAESIIEHSVYPDMSKVTRLKIGAYRKHKDDVMWGDMLVTYCAIAIDDKVLDNALLSEASNNWQ